MNRGITLRKTFDILSIPIDVVTMEEALHRVGALLEEPGFHLVATANAEMLMRAKGDKELAKILQEASLVLPDGAGVLWAAEQRKLSFPERVAGVDLANNLFKKAAQEHIPLYCLGGAEGVVEAAIANMEAAYGKLNLVGSHSGFFSDQEEKTILKDIEEKGAKIVLVALGVPKQEKWLTSKLGHLQGVVGIGLGGTFDVLAGHIERAPKWMQENRLEWLYRLLKQPQRITRMAALPRFVWHVLKDK